MDVFRKNSASYRKLNLTLFQNIFKMFFKKHIIYI